MVKKYLPDAYDDLPLAIICVDFQRHVIIEANKAAALLTGYSEEALTGRDFSAIFMGDLPGQDSQVKQNLMVQHESNMAIKVEAVHLKIALEKTEIALFALIKKTSLAFQPADDRHQFMTEQVWQSKVVEASLNEIIVIDDQTLRLVYINPSAAANLGYSTETLDGLNITDLFHHPDELSLRALLNPLRRSETDRVKLQLKFIRKNGSQYSADVLIQVLEKDKSFMAIATDITDKLMTESRLRKTINEKETLIKEIHHRVKNNLQLISSIIYLKLVTLGESDIKNFLEDTRQKIRSIALIHERLLQTENLDQIEISDYLGKLIHDLRMTYIQPGLELTINTDIEERIMNIDTAIICGLIVNELITNALKHAFRGRPRGEMNVILKFDELTTKHLLTIEDDGVSLPQEINPGLSSSFGMQLIDVFVKQLNGTIDILREKGTKFQIRF